MSDLSTDNLELPLFDVDESASFYAAWVETGLLHG